MNYGMIKHFIFLSLFVVFIVIFVLGVIGFMAGFFPAKSAANIDPARALRHE